MGDKLANPSVGNSLKERIVVLFLCNETLRKNNEAV